MRNITRISVSVGLAALLGAGCTTYKDQVKGIDAAWRLGQADFAAKASAKETSEKDTGKDAVIWHLEAGTAYRAGGNYTNSNEQFSLAANRIEDYEQKAKVRVGNEAGALITNPQNLPYEGKSYDKIMLHTYMALNYLAMGRNDLARPEIIRSYQCQQDAVEENARRIEKAKQEEEKNKDKATVEKSKKDPKFSAALDGLTKPLEGFKYYADYVNPFTVYLDGLYFLYEGTGGSDLQHAEKSFNRVMEISGSNKFILADLEAARNANSGTVPTPCTYVIFETGQAASLDQIRIDIPVVMSKVSYVGTAFPKLAVHDDYMRQLNLKAGEVQETTLPLANMDSIIALDFKNEFPVIVTKTIISTVTKAVASYAANQAASQQSDIAGVLMKIFTIAYQAAVNIADTRSWTTLPKEFQVARIPTPADHKLTLSCGSALPTEVTLLDGAANVVYVRSVSPAAPLLVSQFKLGAKSAVTHITANEIR